MAKSIAARQIEKLVSFAVDHGCICSSRDHGIPYVRQMVSIEPWASTSEPWTSACCHVNSEISSSHFRSCE